MKELEIPFIQDVETVRDLMKDLKYLPPHTIDRNPWPEYASDCRARFFVAHTGDSFVLKFSVQEKHCKTFIRNINDAVNKDNCVEFFIAFGDDQGYYNLEFNCFGVGKMAFGASRTKRQPLPEKVIKLIDTDLDLRSKVSTKHTSFEWEIILYIPVEAFHFHQIKSLAGLKCRANFYKCGDDLPNPHFLSWNMIHSERPDFHQPEFFAPISFNRKH